jgi:peptidyl-prolyl cis-trans isomerase C
MERLLWLAAALFGLSLHGQIGCITRSERSGDAVVGRYEGGTITAEDVQREANRLPPALRQQFETRNGRREVLAAMIDKRLLAKEAERRGYRDDPEIKRQVRELEERLMVQALLAAEERAAGTPTEAEARAWYDSHRQELAQPERVRVARVLAAVKSSASAPERAKARARAEQFSGRLRKGEPFGKVAASGDGEEKSRGGDLGLLVRGASADRELETAVFALRRVGEVSPVIACANGFAVFELRERRETRTPSFEEAKGEVANRLAPQRKRKVFDDLIARLRKGGEVKLEIAASRL